MNGAGDDPRLVTAEFAVAYLNMGPQTDPVTTVNQIHNWAYRGHIRRHGRGPRGRTLYHLDEIVAYLNARRAK